MVDKMKQKKWTRIMAIVFAAILVIGQVAISHMDISAATKRKSLNVKKITLSVGQSKQLKVSGVERKKVKWSSSKSSVVTVSKKGKIKAKKPGKAVITAKFPGGKLKCNVTVKAKKTNKKPAATQKPAVTATPKATEVPTQEPTVTPTPQENKILVAYFSWSGTSERIAKNIIEQTGADSFRIEREVPYSSDYQTTAYGDARVEAETNARPAIKDPLESIAQYDKIIICYPIWWHTAPMTVGTFLESYDFTGKTIYPVSQSASMDKSQYDESVTFIKGCAKGATVEEGIFSRDNTAIWDYINEIINQ